MTGRNSGCLLVYTCIALLKGDSPERRFAGFAEIRGIRAIHEIGTTVHLRFALFSETYKWQQSCIL